MAGFNPNQPRDQEGQWTKAEQAAMLSSGLTEDPEIVEQRIKQNIEYTLTWDGQVEHLFVMRQDGTLVQHVRGTEQRVSVDTVNSSDMENSIMLHNHPGGNAYLRFSGNDFETIGWTDAAEMRLVAGDYMLSVKRPKRGWNITSSFLEKINSTVTNGLLKLLSEGKVVYTDFGAGGNIHKDLDEIRQIYLDAYTKVGLSPKITRWR